MSRRIYCFFLIFFFVALTLLFCMKTSDPFNSGSYDSLVITKLRVDNMMTSPNMSHEKHEEVKCVVCHHKMYNDDRIKICAACHNEKGGEDIIHELCINCHDDKGEGPKECKDCHRGVE